YLYIRNLSDVPFLAESPEDICGLMLLTTTLMAIRHYMTWGDLNEQPLPSARGARALVREQRSQYSSAFPSITGPGVPNHPRPRCFGPTSAQAGVSDPSQYVRKFDNLKSRTDEGAFRYASSVKNALYLYTTNLE